MDGAQPAEPVAETQADDAPDEAVPDEAVPDEAAPVVAARPGRRAPRIHVPADDAPDEDDAPDGQDTGEAVAEEKAESPDGDGAPPARRRTRRGSRGGRNRKRKPAVTNGDGVGADVVESQEAAPPAAQGNGEPEGAAVLASAPPEAPETPERADPTDASESGGYVPMSEWIEDFDRRP